MALPGRVTVPHPHHKPTACGPFKGTSVHHRLASRLTQQRPHGQARQRTQTLQNSSDTEQSDSQSCYILLFKMSNFQSQDKTIMRHKTIQSQDNYETHKETGSVLPYTGKQGVHGNHPGSAQLLNLLDKDFNATTTNRFRKRETQLKNQSVRMTLHQIENARKEEITEENKQKCWHGEVQDLLPVKQRVTRGTIGLSLAEGRTWPLSH